MANLLARVIAAIRNEPIQPPRHYCPHCASNRLRVLGSNAARFNGQVSMVFECLDCGKDSMFSLFRDGTTSYGLIGCERQARCVDHSRAEIWIDPQTGAAI